MYDEDSRNLNAAEGRPDAAGNEGGSCQNAGGSAQESGFSGQQPVFAGTQDTAAGSSPVSSGSAGQAGAYSGAGNYTSGGQPGQERAVYESDHRDWGERRVNPAPAQYRQEEPKKKKGSWAGRAAGVFACALLFGTVAGATMFGVNTVGEYLKHQYLPAVGTEEQPEEHIEQRAERVEPAMPEEDAGGYSAAAPVTQAIQLDVSSIVEKAMPSVVAINSTVEIQQRTWFGNSQTIQGTSSGSGIIVGQNDEELLIVTNNHVIEDAKELTVTFIEDTQVSALVKGTDSENDLAVIAVALSDIPDETMSQIKVAALGDSDAVKVGQGVIAIGNALGYGQSVTVGYVSALNREVAAEDNTTRTLLQTDAAINPGNSGGALLNMRGEVIGINAAKYSDTSVEGMGYAIPISEVQDIISDLMSKKTRVAVEESQQGYLGIQGQNIDETTAAMYGMPKGVYVFKILDDSAAAASDLREKDIITKFDGQTVQTMAELKEMLTYYAGGDTVELTVQSLDNGQYEERTITVTLGTRPAEETN